MTGDKDLAMLKERLAGRRGRAFWRGLDDLSSTPEFRRFLTREFPALEPPPSGPSRREALKVMGASLALAGVAGCDGVPDERALPYVKAPEFALPGQARHYATSVTMGGFAQPVLGETHEGRPTKLEGNPHHPASRGATDAFTQAAILGLYDPDRSQTPRERGRPTDWQAFEAAAISAAAQAKAVDGEGFRILIGRSTSPTLARQLAAMRAAMPKARWHEFEPVDASGYEASRIAFGRPLEQHFRLDEAEATVCLDADILGPGPRQVLHARQWSARRAGFQNGVGECSLLVAEASPSLTGVTAERRLIAEPHRTEALAAAIAFALDAGGEGNIPLSDEETGFVRAAATALLRRRGRSLFIVGPTQPASVQAIALRVNQRLGNIGRTVQFTEALAVLPPEGDSLAALTRDMAAGRVATLAILGANPVYSAPADIPFAAALARVGTVVHAGLHYDETAAQAHWHAPLLHDLEMWSDGRAVDGHAGILQPLVRPFFGGRSPHRLLQILLGDLDTSGYEMVRETWRETASGGDFEEAWSAALLQGYVKDSAPAPLSPVAELLENSSAPQRQAVAAGAPLTVEFRPDASVWDGRFANNAWLQELPRPLSKLVWDNVIQISPALAREQGLSDGDIAEIRLGGRTIDGPVSVVPGQAARTLTLTLGYGRTAAGQVQEKVGFDVYPLRTSGMAAFAEGASLRPTGASMKLATTQLHFAMEGFDFIRSVTPEEVAEGGALKQAEHPSLYPDYPQGSPNWGMSIDLDVCIGCNACVSACNAENNIPMVGKDQVARGREMHWLRIDRYYEGSPDNPRHHFQPVPCMHCEQAPCEMGCPVNATTHSPDGLNQQIYNRCIGTRTCSSFCPYKVRRFNWFDLTGNDPPSVQAARNPDVTVRDRGVMEKCTYCVQRISEARIAAKLEDRSIADGEVLTACQQACPTDAIVFGDITDPASAVSRRKASPRDYSLLEEANTRPRTTYLARIEKEGK